MKGTEWIIYVCLRLTKKNLSTSIQRIMKRFFLLLAISAVVTLTSSHYFDLDHSPVHHDASHDNNPHIFPQSSIFHHKHNHQPRQESDRMIRLTQLISSSIGSAANWQYPCSSGSISGNKAFCNVSLSFEERAKDLIYNELNLTELINITGNSAGSIDRIGVSAYQWWSEALHGVANSPGVSYSGTIKSTTMFPQVIGTSSSFNRTLWHKIGETVSTEARAMNNYAQAGLTFWAPNVNIFRFCMKCCIVYVVKIHVFFASALGFHFKLVWWLRARIMKENIKNENVFACFFVIFVEIQDGDEVRRRQVRIHL